ncbi:MAG: transcription factor [ANME-2 cluster archaeon]|nr:transcription factor [ANME-2 cluster archaeon]MBC2700753.1 transcription factor [ANME-2 cluster archaeon]MBC2709032.1 transcription factor [ANME-2 cluster archaeon]MBC2747292.1 transcription factor [ANME-2 cluster archaeon]
MVNLDDPVIQGLLFNLVGEDGMDVVLNMPDGEITDDGVAEITNVPLNIVRRTLYILFENRLATYRRERNKDSGWLTYLWKIDLNGINELLEAETKKFIRNLKTKFEFENDNMFYVCKNNCGRFVFDTVAELEFLCPNCGEDVIFDDNELIRQTLKKRINELT